jgi:hypothetical protein
MKRPLSVVFLAFVLFAQMLVAQTQPAPPAPQGATVQCRDGTYSFSRSRRGTCSHHGGVAKWL